MYMYPQQGENSLIWQAGSGIATESAIKSGLEIPVILKLWWDTKQTQFSGNVHFLYWAFLVSFAFQDTSRTSPKRSVSDEHPERSKTQPQITQNTRGAPTIMALHKICSRFLNTIYTKSFTEDHWRPQKTLPTTCYTPGKPLQNTIGTLKHF